jgi:hypothetical protein
MPRTRVIDTPVGWLKANGVNLAPLTGTDRRALKAVAEAWTVYADTRHARILDAIAILLIEMQPWSVELTKLLIARAMDWGDVDAIWPLIERKIDAIRADEHTRRVDDCILEDAAWK